MKTKEIIKEIKNNIQDTYFRVDFNFMFHSNCNGCFIITTIEICKNNKYFEIIIWIFCSCFIFIISKESYNEDES